MADDKEKKQEKEPKEQPEVKKPKQADNVSKNGVVNDYNRIGAKVLPHYYDREKTDANVQKDFGDMFADLKQVNMKLKKELQSGQPTKLDIAKDAAKPEK